MNCRACDHPNTDSARFCEQCGESLQRACGGCGAPLVETARFCSQCGASQGAEATSPAPSPVAPAPEEGAATTTGERRQLTAMFCDLVGSTQLAHRLDPEDYRDLVASYQDACSAAVKRFDGHVAQFLGDGVLIYFGYPHAHEDDAERAVRAALTIQASLGKANEARGAGSGVSVEARVGIHTGPVVMGDLGVGDRQQPLALGDTINVASRLERVAEPGGVVISQATLRLVPGLFLTRDLGTTDLKGVSEPVRVHSVERSMAVGSRIATAENLTQLAGRDLELAQLRDRWAQVKEGRGQVVSISGEAGIGKSRLVHALRGELADEPHSWFEACCSPYHTHTALQPVVELLESGLGIRDVEEPTIRLEKLESGLSGIPNLDPSEVLPFLTVLLGLPPSERYPLPALGPELMREKTLQALMSPILAVEPRQPLVIFFEDLHWADPSTLEMLGQLIDEAATIRLMVVLTSRPSFEPPWPARSYMFPLGLSRLGQEQTETIVAAAAGDVRLPKRIVDEIVARADGVPLFAEELTRSVVDSGMVATEGGSAEFRGRLSDLTIPTTLQGSLMARLDRLSATKLVAQIAATLGREFPYPLIEAVAELDAPTLRSGLGQLVDAEILFQRGTPPDARYTFKHALLQDTAYESQLKSRRKELHATIARALEERFPERAASEPAVLAHHCAEGGLVSNAITYYERAAEIAVARLSNVEAIEELSRALELLETLPDSAERQLREIALRMALAGSQTASRGYEDESVLANVARVDALCEGLGAGPQQLGGLVPLAVYCMMRGDLPTASGYAARLLEIVEPLGIAELQVAGHMIVGSAAITAAPISEAVAHLDRAVELAQVAVLPAPVATFDVDVLTIAHATHSIASVLAGDPLRSKQFQATSLERGEGVNHLNSFGSGLLAVAVANYFFDDPHTTGELARKLVEAVEGRGLHALESSGRVFEGWARVMQGDLGGSAAVAEGVKLAEDSGARAGIVQVYFTATDTALAASDFDRATAYLERAREMIEQTRERAAFEPQVPMFQAAIQLRSGTGSDQEIEALLDDSTQRWAAFGSEWMELRTALLRAELAKKTGKHQAAREQLSRLCTRFADLPAIGRLLEARKVLAELD